MELRFTGSKALLKELMRELIQDEKWGKYVVDGCMGEWWWEKDGEEMKLDAYGLEDEA